MELGLSLGETAKPLEFLENRDKSRIKNGGLDFCMRLGVGIHEEREKADEDDEDDDVSEGDGSDDDDEEGETALHLNLLPLAPAPAPAAAPHLQFFPWSSDNGSSENGSSGAAAAKGLDVNKPAAEEASSANSVGSPFHTELLRYRNKGSKRDLEARGNDVAEAERASDDDENNNNRKKLRLSKQQSAFLEESFKEHNTLNPKQKLALAKQLNLRPRQVEVWFQNRRARTKLKQTEVDCEYLKKCCEKLTEENRRLHKEVQELRALKTSNPFYMHRPATTLTMCPSCERVAATAASAKSGGLSSEAAAPKGKVFPPNRPKFFPFPQPPTHPNQPAAS